MTIISTALPFCLAGVLVSQATTVQVICLGRALAGLCIGAMSLSLPVYLAECLRPEVRGRLGLLPTTLGNLGVLICFICGAWLDWAEVKFALLPEGCKKQQITSHPLKNKSTPTSLRNTALTPRASLRDVRGRPCNTFGDVPTGHPAKFFFCIFNIYMWTMHSLQSKCAHELFALSMGLNL